MNKKLMVVAIAAALAPVAAMADSGNVTIYGQMNVSVDSVNPGYDSGHNGALSGSPTVTRAAGIGGQRVTQINDNSSRLGFKGTEALGNGLSAVWQIESQLNVDGAQSAGSTAAGFQPTNNQAQGGATVGMRNTFVGLTGGFGTAVLGRHDTPYKLATRSLDVFADGIADNRSIMGVGVTGVTTFDGRQSNVIAYISPSFSGFTGAIGYVAGSETGTDNSGVVNHKGDAWSAMGTYANGPIFASLAYEKHNVGNTGSGTLGLGGYTCTTNDGVIGDATNPCFGHGGTTQLTNAVSGQNEKAWKLGLGYNMGDFKVGLAYEKTSDDFGSAFGNSDSNMFGHHSVYLSGAYTMGANVIKAAYTKAGDMNFGSNTGAKQYSLGFDHNMSKRTTVYALYTKLNNDDNAAYGLTGGSNGGIASGNAFNMLGLGSQTALGQDPSAVSVGIKHSF